MNNYTSQTKKYYIWIDYAKFISIFLVTSFHVPFRVEGYWGDALTNLRLPLFFFLSGFLFNPTKYHKFSSFFKHRFRQLLVPYFSFFLLFYPLWIFIGKNMGNEADLDASYIKPLIECLYGRPTLVCAPLWFISCLFCLQCIYFFICKAIKKTWILITILILISLFIYVPITYSKAPWGFEKACRYIVFYGIASCFKSEILKIVSHSYRIVLSFMMLLVFLLGVYIKSQTTNVYLEHSLFVICGLLVIYPIAVFSDILSNKLGDIRWVKYITANAIVVLALENYVIGTLKILFFDIIGVNETSFTGMYCINIAFSFIVLALITIPIYIINRYFPFIIGKDNLRREPRN